MKFNFKKEKKVVMKKPILHLAPMCNITNRATREIARENEVDVTWSEMISSEGLVRQDLKNNKSLLLAKKFNSNEQPYWVQIFGNNPKNMALAAKIIEREVAPTGIDINLGCPVPKARKCKYGAVQIGSIPEVVEIIKSIKNSISIPLSLKTRLGLEDSNEILQFAPKLEKAGLDQLVVHARTLKGLFSAEPNWQIIKKLKEKLSIPIIYNGGIDSPEKALFYFKKTGLNNLMVGQASIGRPYIFKEIKYFFEKGTNLNITLSDKKNILLKHAQLVEKYFGRKGIVSFRSQISAYLRNFPAAKKFRSEAVKLNSLKELQKLLDKL